MEGNQHGKTLNNGKTSKHNKSTFRYRFFHPPSFYVLLFSFGQHFGFSLSTSFATKLANACKLVKWNCSCGISLIMGCEEEEREELHNNVVINGFPLSGEKTTCLRFLGLLCRWDPVVRCWVADSATIPSAHRCRDVPSTNGSLAYPVWNLFILFLFLYWITFRFSFSSLFFGRLLTRFFALIHLSIT